MALYTTQERLHRGQAQWSFGVLELRGQASPDGLFQLGDDAVGAEFGAYVFQVNADGTLVGAYGEPNRSEQVWDLVGRRVT